MIFQRGKILLVERGKDPLKGYWSLPGGLVETGESLENAVAREVLEETGLTVKPLYLAEVFQRIMRDKTGRTEYHYVLADYVCKIKSGELKAGDDAGKAAWFALPKIVELLLTEGTKEVVNRAYADYQQRNARI